MKAKFLIFFIAFIFSAVSLSANVIPVANLTGRVTDKQNGQPIIGAFVGVSSLRVGTVTNNNGDYLLTNVPRVKLLIDVSCVGYKTLTQTVDLASTAKVDFELEMSVIEADEVVVTGSPIMGKNSKNSTPIETVTRQQLVQSGASNIVDALSNVPGISQVTTGSAISKPVIRGLSYNRVVTLNNDVKQEGQQWGDEHGIEIDQYGAAKVEVLRGPASLFYGSDALGGVINIIDPVVANPGAVKGQFTTNYSTNNGLTATNIQFDGNANGFVYRINGTYKNAMSYKSPVERVYNSAFREDDIAAMVGLSKNWGFAHLSYSRFNSKLGLTEGERDANGQFVDMEGNTVSATDLKSRSLFLPFQHITHQKVALNSNVSVGSGFLKTTLGFQNNQRRELEESIVDPSAYFYLNTYSLDSKYYFEAINGWAPVIGISGIIQNNSNRGEEALIPAYDMYSGGIFTYVKKEWEKTSIDAGMRFDTRKINGKEEFDFSAFSNSFSNISASVGATHQLSEKINLKGHIGRGFRAPNIAELSANGVHEGAFRYEIGNPELKQETSLQFDASMDWVSKYLTIELNGYYNFINDYIYYQNTNNEEIVVDGELFPVYRYVQGNSAIRGLEFSFDVHPVDQLHFENSFAYTRGTNNEAKTDLPFIPQAKLINTIRYDFEGKKEAALTDLYASLGVETSFKQDKVDPFETVSNGYTLLNLSIGATIHSKAGKPVVSLFVSGKNLTDKNYIDHLSRFKGIGVSNIGRNITFGITVPFAN
ncbi:TonB-dependent receptor [Solitalea lacus]|uniref:TonB-dependent receptor n=1 Tax=Solitalea lacus TaxID=2911172 RepID=UPI001EDB1499|nr:TonB-dependent receptor [Solitalea lacus]UKJ07996.1 TonB-dependent receptor [Solitalea lacus]